MTTEYRFVLRNAHGRVIDTEFGNFYFDSAAFKDAERFIGKRDVAKVDVFVRRGKPDYAGVLPEIHIGCVRPTAKGIEHYVFEQS